MTATIDVRRVLRTAALLLCVAAASLVYLAFVRDVDAASLRVDRAELQLDSDRSTFYDVERLRHERDDLSNRYERLFAENPEAAFLRSLSADVARHGVALVSTAEARDASGPNAAVQPAGSRTPDDDRIALDVQMRGRYRNLLAAVGELSLGPEVVRVDLPTLRREGTEITVSVPVTIFEPMTRARADVAAP